MRCSLFRFFVAVAFIVTTGCYALTQQDTAKYILTIEHPVHGRFYAYRPDLEEFTRTSGIAKAIFTEAFSQTYSEFYRRSGALESIECWLGLGEKMTFNQWISDAFDTEYNYCIQGHRFFIYLKNEENHLVGWLSHSPVSDTGELYFAQCSLEASIHGQKVATSVFAEAINNDQVKVIFPGVKEIKLVTRKINQVARRLYEKTGFIVDETIDPAVYGDGYNERYIGFRLTVSD